MTRYYDLGFEAGAADFEQGSYVEPEDLIFSSAMSADDCKDYMAGYHDGWYFAEEMCFDDFLDEMEGGLAEF